MCCPRCRTWVCEAESTEKCKGASARPEVPAARRRLWPQEPPRNNPKSGVLFLLIVLELRQMLPSRFYLALTAIKTEKFLQTISFKRWGFQFNFKKVGTYLLCRYLIPEV